MEPAARPQARCLHTRIGAYIRPLVFGALDGLLTSFAKVAGCVGVGMTDRTVLAIGVANLLADALVMAMGDFLSSKSERERDGEERARCMNEDHTRSKEEFLKGGSGT